MNKYIILYSGNTIYYNNEKRINYIQPIAHNIDKSHILSEKKTHVDIKSTYCKIPLTWHLRAS